MAIFRYYCDNKCFYSPYEKIVPKVGDVVIPKRTLDIFLEEYNSNAGLPYKFVCLGFEDGYRDFLTVISIGNFKKLIKNVNEDDDLKKTYSLIYQKSRIYRPENLVLVRQYNVGIEQIYGFSVEENLKDYDHYKFIRKNYKILKRIEKDLESLEQQGISV